ncbi:MAG: SRPBCC family protein [Candidatus Limnocylindria bacterium]
MAIEIEIAQRIRRPRHEVAAFVADLEGWPRWLIASGIVAVRRAPKLAGTVPRVGESMSIDQRAAGRAGTFAVTVTAADPESRLALEGRDGDGVRIAIDAVLVPDGAEATELRWSFRIELPFRYRFFESMAAPQVRHATALDLEALRLRLEAAGGAGAAG